MANGVTLDLSTSVPIDAPVKLDMSTSVPLQETPKPEQPSALDHIMHGAGEFWNDLKSSGKGIASIIAPPESKSDMAAAAVGPAGLYAKRAIGGYYDAVRHHLDAAEQASKSGDTAGALFHSVSAGLPLVGPLVGDVYDKANSGDLAGAIGLGASRIAQAASMAPEGSAIPNPLDVASRAVARTGAAAIERARSGPPVSETAANPPTIAQRVAASVPIIKQFVDGPPEDLLTRAIKPGNKNQNWSTDIKKAIPEIKRAEQTLGRPIQNVDDALQATAQAKKAIWDRYRPRMASAEQAGVTLDGNQVANAMVRSIDARTATQSPGLVESVRKVADTYRHDIPVADAEEFLQSANRDLNTYYAKNKVGQYVAKGDPSIASTVAESDALRSALYQKLDQIYGSGSAKVKQQYGALSNVEKELLNRQNVAARQQPVSLSEQLSAARAYGKIGKGMLTGSPGSIIEGSEQLAAAKWLKERQTTDAMITRAFAAAKTPPPFPAPRLILSPPPGAPPAPQQLPLSGTEVQTGDAFSPQKLPTTNFTSTDLLMRKSGLYRDPRTGKVYRIGGNQ